MPAQAEPWPSVLSQLPSTWKLTPLFLQEPNLLPKRTLTPVTAPCFCTCRSLCLEGPSLHHLPS